MADPFSGALSLGLGLIGGKSKKGAKRAQVKADFAALRAQQEAQADYNLQQQEMARIEGEYRAREDAALTERLRLASELRIKEANVAAAHEKEIIAKQKEIADRALEQSRLVSGAPVTVPIAVPSSVNPVLIVAVIGLGALMLMKGRR